MPRLVRTVMPAILPVVLALALVAMGPGASIGVSGGAVALAAVSWPPSTGLVVGEVVTGGASASDEFVELYNAGLSSIDLAGLEVVYVTSTGGTVTRKATWASTTMLEPGRHLLLANSAGMHAPIGDAVYTGGLAATGGAIAVRPIGGDAIDAVGWGDATNAFVEGAVAPAPPAGTSLERLPGGAAGNSIDTNDNASDWLLDPAPVAQNLAAPAVPAAGASATPSPTSTPTATPSPTSAPTATPTLVPTPSPNATPAPTATPTLVPTPSPSATPAPTATPTLVPTPSPSATPAPTATPTPSPTVTPTTAPSPSASPTPGIELIDIALARSSATDTRVRVRGMVTVEPGRIVDDRTLAIQDGTAGILIRLDGGRKDLVVARGSDVVVEGRLTSRYGTLEIRLDDGDPLDILGSTALPTARPIQLTALGEATEGLLVHASGTLTDIDVAKSGTTTIVIEDASGRGRIVAFAGAGALPDGLRRGVSLAVEGIAGQRASAKGRLDGYRIWVRDGGDLRIVVPAPSPATSASPSRAPEGSPSPSTMTIAAARSRTGQKVTVEGTITTQGGLFDADGRRVTIQDGTAGILLRLAAREKAPPVGSRIRVAGTIGTYYGAPQLAATGPAERFGSAPIAPPTITKAPGAAVEWQLIRVKGTIVDVKRTGQAWRAELAMAGGIRVAIVGLSRARISSDRIREGAQGAIVGIVRRAYPTATDRRFAVLPRGRGDLDLTTVAATPSTGTSGSDHTDAGAGSSGGDGTASAAGAASALSDTAAPTLDMIELSANVGRLVRVGGLVTRVVAPDADEAGPTVEIEDASGAAALRLPFEATTMAMSLATGDLVEARGIVEVAVDDQVIVSVDDAADFVLAGQVASAGGSHGSTASPGSEADAGSLSGAGGGSGVQEPVGGLDAGDAAMTPLMGATGAGVILGGILGTGAAAAHWRRRRARRQASKEATERLVDLLSGPREGHMGTQDGGVSRESFDS